MSGFSYLQTRICQHRCGGASTGFGERTLVVMQGQTALRRL
jgi:hypothetical protein